MLTVSNVNKSLLLFNVMSLVNHYEYSRSLTYQFNGLYLPSFRDYKFNLIGCRNHPYLNLSLASSKLSAT